MSGENLGRFPGGVRANVMAHDSYKERRDAVNSAGGTVRRIAIGADHGGFAMKEFLKGVLERAGFMVLDVGTSNGEDKVDYPDFAYEVAYQVARENCDRGIMIDAMGIGSSMVCNKVRGVRAALCYDMASIRNSRLHNNANVLTLGATAHTPDEAAAMVRTWLETPFEGGRHWPRINKMMATERRTRNDTTG
ncbi:MAG: ribose 5-phosphate isomerase B [bacterium]